MLRFDLLVFASLLYVLFLFFVAFAAERAVRRGRAGWLHSPLIYTLSLSVYCTAWTFYGAVGFAARSGLEYLTIYLGPTGVLIGWWWVLRHLVRIGRAERITSIADLISSRFGKSVGLGVLVTLLAVVGTTPYIALQLQSVTLSLSVFSDGGPRDIPAIALWVAVVLAIFTILFGTRNLDVNERHSGIVMAIAVEAVVKLAALLAVGSYVVWGLAGGIGATLTLIDQSTIAQWGVDNGRWVGLTFLSAAAFLCLPRMFQVMVVENADESHLATAGWAFPLYLLAMSLFVVPIAVVGLKMLPEGSNPDLFVLTLPLSTGQEGLATFAFLGGFSSATSMVIVAAIAVATMVSNHIVTPLWLRLQRSGASISGDVRSVVIATRRVSIAALLGLGYLYYQLSGGGAALAAIGLVSFTGMAQVLPAMLGGMFWRGATRFGAGAGLLVGFGVWVYTMFLPSFGADVVYSRAILAGGPVGLEWLRPEALFGITGLDPVMHALLWSMLLNATTFICVSLCTTPSPLERVQSLQFLPLAEHAAPPSGWRSSTVAAEELLIMAQRILGAAEAQGLFTTEADRQGRVAGDMPDVTPEFLERIERRLAGSVGAATANAMVSQMTGTAAISVEDLMAVADETAQIMEYSNQLELKSNELASTARQLRDANAQLTRLSVQKDSFLSQISHELRTPMTSIRAFSEILQAGGLSGQDQTHYASIILAEAQRLTRLLDDLLDLSVLESGQVALDIAPVRLGDVLDQAGLAAAVGGRLQIIRDAGQEALTLHTDAARLSQVFINLISNAAKYCDAPTPCLSVTVRRVGAAVQIDFSDNGNGIKRSEQSLIFEKFTRASDTHKAGSAGLGLAICREVMTNLGGTIDLIHTQKGATFRVSLPLQYQG